MPSSGLGAYQVKIHQIIFGGIFFALVASGVRAMMFGSSSRIELLAAASVGIAIIMAMDRYYWLLCPVLISLGIRIPGLPFDGSELGCLILIGVYFIRTAMQKERRVEYSARILMPLPIIAWILLIWTLNPTGFTILGSSSIGARFYFKIIVGFLAFLVLSTLRLSERDCKVLFYSLFLTSVVSFLNSLLSRTLYVERLGEVQDPEPLGSQYYLLGALSLYMLMFARYSVSQILRSGTKLVLTMMFAGLVVLSGKRQGFGTLFLTPIFRVVITRKNFMSTAMCVFIFSFFVMIGVAGHGTLWEIPQSAQRGLSVVVPQFKTGSAMGTTDIFREGVNRVAREQIRQNPWVGRKGYAMERETTSWIVFSEGVGADSLFEGHAFSGNWHNLWYAFACDFGIPCLVFFGLFVLYLLVYVFKSFPSCVGNEYMSACYLFYAYNLLSRFVFASVAGHSSVSLQDIFIKYGFVLAIANGARFTRLSFRASGSLQTNSE